MIIMLFGAVFAVLLLQTFYFSYAIQGLNKTIIFTPIELMYGDVGINNMEASIDKKSVTDHLLHYYNKTIPRYCSDYTIDFYFYNKEDESICISDYCDALEVDINAKVALGYNYHRVMYYELTKGS